MIKILNVILGFAILLILTQCTEDTNNKQVTSETAKETSAKDSLIVNRAIMTISDIANPTKAELKHTPEINVVQVDTSGLSEIKITIGSKGIIHPSVDNHWIDFIKLYKNADLIGHIEFENGKSKGIALFKLPIHKGDILKAESGCNIHGIWSSELVIE